MTTTEIRPFRVVENGELRVDFHPGQIQAMTSLARFVLVMAGTQGGKTVMGPHWLYDRIVEAAEKLAPDEPLGDFLAVTATYDLFQQKMLPEMLEVFVRILGIGYYWAGTRTIELREGLSPNGKLWAGPKGKASDRMWGRIILRSAEASSGLEAATAKAAWLDELGLEEFTLEAWEAIIRRLSLYEGRILGTTTLYNSGWLKFEVYDKWEAGDSDYEVIQFDSTMNPSFPQREFDRMQQVMQPAKFDMMYRGRYAQSIGLVYKSLDTQACVIPRFEIPDNWLWYTGHDFGGKNPATMVYAQDPATSLIYAVYEYLPNDESVHEQVSHLQTLMKNRRVIKRQGGSHQEVGWRGDYTAQGWPITEPPVSAVDVGIAAVYALHSLNRIMIFNDLKHYLDEKLSYSYRLGEGQRVTDEIRNKSAYHLMDAERYALCGFRDAAQATSAPRTRHSGRFGYTPPQKTLAELLQGKGKN